MTRWWNRPRFDVWEVLLMVVVAAAAVYGVQRWTWARASDASARISYAAFSAAEEAAGLEKRYGPGRYSRNEEEWIIRDYFQDGRGGYFIDVGANHYQIESNTYYLETRLGWSGLAIDPQDSFAADYRRYRPRTRFFSFFVSDTSNATTRFYETPENPLVASSDRGFAERNGTEIPGAAVSTKEVTVPTIRLTDLLDHVGVTHIDLLSVDVELAEPKVLAGFDIDRFRPTLVVIEAHHRVRQQILDYFADHRYVALGRYLRADLQNLYFTPLQARQSRKVQQ